MGWTIAADSLAGIPGTCKSVTKTGAVAGEFRWLVSLCALEAGGAAAAGIFTMAGTLKVAGRTGSGAITASVAVLETEPEVAVITAR